MKTYVYKIVNTITLYRLIAAPVLLLLLLVGYVAAFSYGLVISFATDAIDGLVARRFNAVTKSGAKLDTVADDLTVAVGIIGILIIAPQFIREQLLIVIILIVLYVVQTVSALLRYGKLTAFHTRLAKIAAVLQGIFLMMFFFYGPFYFLFYAAAVFTALDLGEEILMIFILKSYHTDVKDIWSAIRVKNQD